MFAALVLAAGLLSAPGSADLSVDLVARGTLLIPGVVYDVKVTNHGPDPLTSATVVVTLDSRAYTGSSAAPCVYDSAADTLTCTAGPVPAGGTTTLRGHAYFIINVQPRNVDATATRTASTPPDPNTANDSDTERCDYHEQPSFPPPPNPVLRCAFPTATNTNS